MAGTTIIEVRTAWSTGTKAGPAATRALMSRAIVIENWTPRVSTAQPMSALASAPRRVGAAASAASGAAAASGTSFMIVW